MLRKEKKQQKQHSQCNKEKSGEGYHMCDEAKIIPQNLYALCYLEKERELFIFLPISVSSPFNFPLLCLSIAYAYNLFFLILQSHHFILSLLFSNVVLSNFSLNLHILHLDH